MPKVCNGTTQARRTVSAPFLQGTEYLDYTSDSMMTSYPPTHALIVTARSNFPSKAAPTLRQSHQSSSQSRRKVHHAELQVRVSRCPGNHSCCFSKENHGFLPRQKRGGKVLDSRPPANVMDFTTSSQSGPRNAMSQWREGSSCLTYQILGPRHCSLPMPQNYIGNGGATTIQDSEQAWVRVR